MPPFAQFRMWLREGPLAEKLSAGVAGAVLVALAALALVPVHRPGDGQVAVPSGAVPVAGSTAAGPAATGPGAPATGGTAPAAASAPGSGGAAVAAGGSGVGGSGTPASAPAAAGAASSGSAGGVAGPGQIPAAAACRERAAGGPGVTATEIHIDMAEVDLAGPVGNAAFGIRSDTPQIVAAVVDHINKTGGVACGRKLVVTQYKVNPVDPNDEQSKCLQMVQDGVLEVINAAGYVTPVSEQCFIQNHVPLETLTSVGRQQAISSYPYLFSPLASSEQQVRDGILGLAARHEFQAPAFSGHLGVFEDDCLPSANQEISRDLAASGVKSDQESTYVMDCALIGQPNQISAAVLQNKLAGDTQVFLASTISNDQNYVRLADQQDFHPRYLTADYGTPYAPGQTWDSGFDGALAITSTRAGELDSGIHSPGEMACNQILVSHGIRPLTNGASDVGATSICDTLNLFVQAVDHAGLNPTRLSLVQGLSTSGPFQSAGLGDSDWNRPGKLTGGDYQREIEYHVACQCWKVVDAAFGPAY